MPESLPAKLTLRGGTNERARRAVRSGVTSREDDCPARLGSCCKKLEEEELWERAKVQRRQTKNEVGSTVLRRDRRGGWGFVFYQI